MNQYMFFPYFRKKWRLKKNGTECQYIPGASCISSVQIPSPIRNGYLNRNPEFDAEPSVGRLTEFGLGQQFFAQLESVLN